MNEYIIIYRQECGAKYNCIETNADTGEEAKNYILTHYSYLVNENNLVKVVKIGKFNYKE